MYCVYCGQNVGEETACRNCGAYRIGSDWHPAQIASSAPLPGHPPAGEVHGEESGWEPDPTGRHEGRYFVSGHPTDLIRDGDVESVDPEGEQELEQHTLQYPLDPTPSAEAASRSRRRWLVLILIGFVLVLAGVGGVIWGRQLTRESPDEKYLAALKSSGLAGQFASNANAIAHAKQTCRTLDEGGPQQGLAVDKVAVDAYCPKFSNGFHVLETVTVSGTFTLIDSSPNAYYPSITSFGSSCSGSDGYSDVSEGTQVVVKNGRGEILATTTLGQGTGSRYRCTFPVSFDITEGEDHYLISTGRRGEISFTFTQLKVSGLALTLGQ